MATIFDLGKVRGGVVVLGTFATLADLQAAVPAPDAGDAYSIGAAAPYDLHIWDERKGEWINYGPMSGIQGEQGPAATIRIGSVSEGEQANVMNSGTENAAVFDFVLPRGKQGEQGIQGETGAPFTYDMFTPEQLEALRGKDGNDGKDGAAATVTVGTVTTLPANSQATVENVGTASAAVLNFGIPKGRDGEGGGGGGDMYKATYDANDDGIVDKADDALKLNGKTDTDFAPAVHGHQAEQVTFADGQTFQQKYDAGELKGQQGEPGKDGVGTPGKDGADGKAATITVGSVTTGAAGTSASVVNTGTENAAVLNFTIPRGADGGKGDPGYTPQKGVDYYTAADKQEMVNSVLAALPTWTGGSY
jgi:hypothetical protein